jgi:mannose-6-phosphate isomerase-like protein (cupin superfamily)
MKVFDLAGLVEEHRRSGKPWTEFLRVPAMSLGLYVLRPGEDDPQTPHAEDEIYYVLRGRARFSTGDDDRPVRAGDLIFVEAKATHRFHAVAEELVLLVAFAPAEDEEAAKRLA